MTAEDQYHALIEEAAEYARRNMQTQAAVSSSVEAENEKMRQIMLASAGVLAVVLLTVVLYRRSK